ncbi:HAD family hydrolase [Maribacter sp. 2304DJ31-5]|uniref:HAD family hydrolase n=1 Tax=Maribacter sp. 2304DJ31-5 TaxID=3386273 RepID=UPI0039BCB893
MMMKSWSATLKVSNNSIIAFDLDDTLYKEVDFLKSAYLEIAQELDANKWNLLYIEMFSMYRSGNNVFEFLTKKYEINLDDLLLKYRNHFPNIEVSDGVLNLLKNIKKNKGKIAIITDGRSQTQRNKIDALGLIEYIDTILISEEIGYQKPALKVFDKLEGLYPNHEFTYIADNLKKDFISPNLLNWDSIHLLDNGLNIHVNQMNFMKKENLPKKYVASLNQIEVV